MNSHSSHTRTEPQSNLCHSLVRVWCGGSNATAPTTSADQPEKKSGVKMSDSPFYRTHSAHKNQISCRASHLIDRQTPSLALSCPSSFSNANTHEMTTKRARRNPNSNRQTPMHRLSPLSPVPISFCGRLFALKISARHSASRHNAHVVVINHNYHGFKKPQLLFDFKNKP